MEDHSSLSEKTEPLQPSESAKAGDYLPGGRRYQDMIGRMTAGNPREDASMPQWMHEWEQKWQHIIGEGKKDGWCLWSFGLTYRVGADLHRQTETVGGGV